MDVVIVISSAAGWARARASGSRGSTAGGAAAQARTVIIALVVVMTVVRTGQPRDSAVPWVDCWRRVVLVKGLTADGACDFLLIEPPAQFPKAVGGEEAVEEVTIN